MFLLETLPGWPEAQESSVGFLLMLMIIGPLLVGLVVAAIGWTPKLADRSEDDEHSTELTTRP